MPTGHTALTPRYAHSCCQPAANTTSLALQPPCCNEFYAAGTLALFFLHGSEAGRCARLVCGVVAPARFLTRPFLGPPLPGVSKFLFLCFALGLPIVCYLRGGMCSYFVQFCTRLPTLTWCQHPFQEHRADETRQINEQRCVIHVLQTQQELQRACRLQGLATVSVLGASRSR
jgi:hypothetical protein